MERGLLLDVVVAQRAAIFELLAREDEALLVGRDALLVLDLLLDVVDRVARLDIERDGLARERLDEDLRGGGGNRFGLGGLGGRGRFDELSSTGMCCGRGGAAAPRAPVPFCDEAANPRRPGRFVLRRFLPRRGRGCGSAMALCGATKVARRPGGSPAGPAALRAKFHSERLAAKRAAAGTAEHAKRAAAARNHAEES